MSKLSIVMPVKDNEQYLDEAITSILCQTEKDYEFLIFADRCNDETIYRLNQYKDNRIKIFTDPSITGVTNALNFLISKSSTNIIARQDADDTSTPNRIDTFFKNNITSSLTTSNYLIKYNNKIITENKSATPVVNIFKFLFFYNFGAHGQLFFNKRYYNKAFKFCQDYELCSEILRENYTDYYLIDEPLYMYRKHSKSINSTYRSKQIYFSLLTSQANIKHFLNLNLTLNKVKDLREYFLENKKPSHTSEVLFLSLIKTIITKFKAAFTLSSQDIS